MVELNNLQNTSRPFKRTKRVGRGMGSGLGKTSGRGHKGMGSRSGYQTRARYEGGQLPLYRKLPQRGFSTVQFQKRLDVINLGQIEDLFQDGEVVSVLSLREKGFLKGTSHGIKILGQGDLSKKVTIEASAISKSALDKLNNCGISYTIPAVN